MKKILIIPFCLLAIVSTSNAQDKAYAKKLIDTLASPYMAGRGIVDHGSRRAARLIKDELEHLGVLPVNHKYYQYFEVDANTFPHKPTVKISGKEMAHGPSYHIISISSSIHDSFAVKYLDPVILSDTTALDMLDKEDLSRTVLMVDDTGYAEPTRTRVREIMYHNELEAAGIVQLTDRLVMLRSTKDRGFPAIQLLRDSLPAIHDSIIIHIDNEMVYDYKVQNVLGMIPGDKDKVIVFTAHYDHMGRIGDIYIPGANDNASGVAMLLDIARHYAKSGEEPEYTLVFIFFTGEEFGLLGSDHYVNFPLFPLEDIELVINLDMVGTGENGIGVAGGKIYEDVFEEIVEINEENGYLKDVKAHGMSRSSDHYPFHEKGVPAIFIHTKGHYPHYHNIYDNRESIPLTGYEDLFRLLTDLIEKL
jgi:aminopeptidase YwaD